MQVRQIAWIDPTEAAGRLAGLPHLALLDSAMGHETLGRFSYLAADPFGIFTVRAGTAFWNGAAEPGPLLAALRRRLAACRTERLAGLPPFQGGAIGLIGYEYGWALEGRAPPHPAHGDDMHLAFFDVVLAFDHVASACWLIASGLPAPPIERRRRAAARLDEVASRLERRPPSPGRPADIVWRPTISREAYAAGIARVQDYIRAGDIYQANIAQRFVADLPPEADPWSLYLTLRAANPAPFAAYLDCGARKILCSSPELFLRSDGRTVETRPIKGTARRDDDETADAARRAALIASRKDRAENVMIVDLLRNDLAKVCRPTSVEVPLLCGLESYAGLHHLVSAVTGTLRDRTDALDLLAATFPGGSITGAPKLRAMEIIAEIEGRARGAYCGAIGGIGFDGSMMLNIAIRTLVLEAGRLELGTGGGITILSDAEAEYEETLTKAHRIFAAFATAANDRAGRELPSPLAGEGARRADEGSPPERAFGQGRASSGSTPSSDPASRGHLLPQGEKDAAAPFRDGDRHRILVVDNYDSFVHNVARYLAVQGATVEVVRNDRIALDDVRRLAPDAIVVSPGPCTPAEAGISNALIQTFSGTIPILGVCLGHQCIGAMFGGRVARARRPMHGLASDIVHGRVGLFAGLPSPLPVGRYHSLVVERTPAMDRCLTIDATSPDGEIMALSHKSHPTWGVQFHPESVLTPSGEAIFANFLRLAAAFRRAREGLHVLA